MLASLSVCKLVSLSVSISYSDFSLAIRCSYSTTRKLSSSFPQNVPRQRVNKSARFVDPLQPIDQSGAEARLSMLEEGVRRKMGRRNDLPGSVRWIAEV